MQTDVLTFKFPNEVQELINGKTLSHIAQEIEFQIIVNGENKHGNIVGELTACYDILLITLTNKINKLETKITNLLNKGLIYGSPEVLKLREQIRPLKTEVTHAWLIQLTDDHKQRFILNMRKPHSIINIIARSDNYIFNDYQNIDAHYLYNALKKRFGYWANSNKVSINFK